ncbi:MAG: thiamine phosphate synthase, partial [bacterium]
LVPVTGTAPLREVKNKLGLCTLAIGGIEAGNVAEVMSAGADGVAVIRAILDRDDPGAAAAELIEKLRK